MRKLCFWTLAVLSWPLLAQVRMVPHVTPIGAAFETDFILANTSEEPLSFRLTPYAADGSVLSMVTGSLAALETRYMSNQQLFAGEAVAWFHIEDQASLAITVAYQDGNRQNSQAHISESSQQSQRWRIYPGDLDDVIDGIAVVNFGEQASELRVRQVRQDGSILNDVQIGTEALGAKAKALYLFADDFASMMGSWFEVYSDQPLGLTALRFAVATEGTRYFWQTAATAMPALLSDPRIGAVATLSGRPMYEVSGRAVVLDERTVQLQDFHYTGGGADVRVYLGLDGDFLNGFIISGPINGQPYDQATLTFSLPEGYGLDDFNSISIWCTLFSFSFGEGTFQ